MASGTFGFIVQGTRYDVHRALITRTSISLNVQMNDSLLARDRGYVDLENVNKATFARYLQWIYRGDYEVPTGGQRDPAIRSVERMSSREGVNLFSAVMDHVRLYVFAEEKDIPQLCYKVMARLEERFDKWAKEHMNRPSNDFSSSDIVELLRYVYQNPAKVDETYYESLAEIIISRLLNEILLVAQTKEFQDLCVDNDEIVGEILSQCKVKIDSKTEPLAPVE